MINGLKEIMMEKNHCTKKNKEEQMRNPGSLQILLLGFGFGCIGAQVWKLYTVKSDAVHLIVGIFCLVAVVFIEMYKE